MKEFPSNKQTESYSCDIYLEKGEQRHRMLSNKQTVFIFLWQFYEKEKQRQRIFI